MIKITNEVGGKKYELVKESLYCVGCDLLDKNNNCMILPEQRRYNGINVCGKLKGIWKEVRDD